MSRDERETFAEELEVIRSVYASGRLSYLNGRYGREFELRFADRLGAPFAVSCNSGTNALVLALMSLDLAPGSEVITTPMTFVSTVHAIVLSGLVPRIADIGADEPGLTVASVAACVNERTAALLPVHVFGYPCDMPALMELAQKHDLKVVEDCAQALGSKVAGRHCGTFGDANAFSFCFTKTMTLAGEGGMVLASDPELALRCAGLRNVGYRQELTTEGWRARDKGAGIGFNMRLLEIQSALGLHELLRLDEELERRRRLARGMRRIVDETPWLTCYPEREEDDVVYHQLPVLVAEEVDHITPADVVRRLRGNDVPADMAYRKGVHQYPFFRDQATALAPIAVPCFEDQTSRLFILKLSARVGPESLERMAETLREIDVHGEV
jgi:dTDP-4-amino-4,6-dideoxygalactose transaminase